MRSFTRDELASFLDHTMLMSDAVQSDLDRVVEEALRLKCKSVCVLREWLPYVVKKLQGSSVMPITVVSFPEGSASTDQKVAETRDGLERGAREIDMVMNRQLLKAKDYSAVLQEIGSVVKAAAQLPVKVILETSELDRDEKVAACVISQVAGAKFVKTSTGFSKSGATMDDIALMRKVVRTEMGVKASGGVRSFEDAMKMIEAGATRIGTSSAVQILECALAEGSGGY